MARGRHCLTYQFTGDAQQGTLMFANSDIEFGDAAAEVAAFDGVGGESQGALVAFAGLDVSGHAAEQIGAGGVIEVIRIEFAGDAEAVDQRQAVFEPGTHGDRDGVVQRDDRRGLERGENGIERGDLGPVGLSCGACFSVDRGDCGLELIWARFRLPSARTTRSVPSRI